MIDLFEPYTYKYRSIYWYTGWSWNSLSKLGIGLVIKMKKVPINVSLKTHPAGVTIHLIILIPDSVFLIISQLLIMRSRNSSTSLIGQITRFSYLLNTLIKKAQIIVSTIKTLKVFILRNWQMSRNSWRMRFWTNVYGNFFHSYDEPNPISDFDQLFQDYPVYISRTIGYTQFKVQFKLFKLCMFDDLMMFDDLRICRMYFERISTSI